MRKYYFWIFLIPLFSFFFFITFATKIIAAPVDCSAGQYSQGTCSSNAGTGCDPDNPDAQHTAVECCRFFARDLSPGATGTCVNYCSTDPFVPPPGSGGKMCVAPPPPPETCVGSSCGGSYQFYCCSYSVPSPSPSPIPPTPTPIPTATPTPIPSCSSFTSCSACITGGATCGWNGSSCQSGTSSCPAGGTTWNWWSCSQNECTAPSPTPI